MKVTTSTCTIEGTVYTADPLTSLLILNTSNTTANIHPTSLSAPSGAYRIIPLSQIQSFQTLSLPNPSETSSSNTTTSAAHDIAAITHRLNANITAQQNAQARQGPRGTLPLEQALYDALSRTHPARWEGSTMVISDCFAIEKPYQSANVGYYHEKDSAAASGEAQQNGGGGGFKGDLERFRKVVDMEASKAALRFGKGGLDKRLPVERKGG